MKRSLLSRISGATPALICVGIALTVAEASASAPVITAPVVGSISPGTGVSITVAGSGFLGGYFPQIVFTGSLSLTVTLVDPNNPDPRIRKWTDDQILVDQLPDAALTAQVKVNHTGGTSATANLSYLYDWTSVPAGDYNGSPLALGIGRQPTLWINQEFHNKFRKLDLVTGTVSDLPLSGTQPVFESTYGDPPVEYASVVSASGEDVQVDANGRAWFTESGAGPGWPSAIANHSRIVRYDPATPTAPPMVYNLPGDDNQVNGLALDSPRVWYATSARFTDPLYPPVIPARLYSFNPYEGDVGESPGIQSSYDFGFPTGNLSCTQVPVQGGQPAGSCSPAGIAFKQCLTPADCVLAEQICPVGATGCTQTGVEASYFHEYSLSSPSPASFPASIGHLLVEGPSNSRTLWYTVFSSWPPTARLGRLDLTQAGLPKEYPLATVPPLEGCTLSSSDIRCTAIFFGAAPWQLAKSPTGDIVLSEHFTNRLGRFDVTRVGDSACEGIPSGFNPCIQEAVVPAADLTNNYLHSIAYDPGNNLWFTMSYGHNDTRSTVGFLKPDWNTFVMLPALSAFSFPSQAPGSGPCNAPLGENLGVMATGIVTDPVLGDLWFGDYCRKRVGRLRDASAAHNLPMDITTGSDDAWEDNTDQSPPSKPKLTATTLQLRPAANATTPRSTAAYRFRTAGGAFGKTLTSHLTLPINGIGSTRDIELLVSIGVPNDGPFNPDGYGDIKSRARLASLKVLRKITPATTSIVIDSEITRLLDVAQRDPHWLAGQVNMISVFVARTDTLGFTLNLQSYENSSNTPTLITSVRGGV